MQGGTEAELGIAAGIFVAVVGVAEGGGEVVVFYFGGEVGGEGAGVEEGGGGHAGVAVEEAFPDGFDIEAEGGDPADSGDYDTFTHGFFNHQDTKDTKRETGGIFWGRVVFGLTPC